MKISIFLLIISVLQVFAKDSYSQTTKLSLSMNNVTVEQVLDKIENQSEFFFLYNHQLVDVNRKVNIDVTNKKIKNILTDIFADTDIRYLVMGRQIILTPKNMLIKTAKDKNSMQQQQKTITGKVTDESGSTLPGVNIMVKGTTQGTITDANGIYTINVKPNATLEFSFVGYANQEISVTGKSVINITMAQETISLEQVVTTGYQKRMKGEVTGSIGQTTGHDIVQATTPDIREALQGKVAGLVINDRGGEPGHKDLEILIRGKHTLGNNSPLVVVDGVPRSDFSNLSPNDIESISVLKDAAAAIYGARAANGVILVETKKGKKGLPVISLQAEYAFQQLTEHPVMMNSYERAVYENEGFEYVGSVPNWSDEAIEHFRLGDKPLEYPNTNWLNEMIDDRAPQSHLNLSVRGGSERVNYYVSGDYLYQDNLAKGRDQDYKQYQIRSNVNIQVLKRLRVGAEIEARTEKTRWFSNYVTPWNQIEANYPWTIARWPNGKLGPSIAYGGLGTIERDKSGFNDNIVNTAVLKLDFAYDMSWVTKGLKFTGFANYIRRYGDNRIYAQPWTVYNRDPETGEYFEETANVYNSRLSGKKSVRSTSSSSSNNFYQLMLSYKNSFGNHNISGFVAFEQSESFYKNLWAFRIGLPSDKKPYLWAGQDDERNNNESLGQTGRINYFGTLSYNYARKYLIDFTLRYDGSFNFPPEKRFGLFPGIAIAYNIANEPFMESLSWLDALKLRASYASMGNDAVPQYQYLSLYRYGGRDKNLWWNNNNYSFGVSPSLSNGFQLLYTPNPDITWEVSKNQNLGIDMSILKGLFNFTFDVFKEKRSNILLSRSAAIPAYTALALPDENIGKVENKGLEFSFNHTNKVGQIDYSIGGNFTFTRNKVIYMAEPDKVLDYQKREGKPMDSWYVYKTDGLYLTDEDLNSSPHLNGAQLGDIKYVDMNGDGMISGDDMYRKFTSQTPEIVFAFNMGVGYKGIRLDLFFVGQTQAETSVYSNYHWNQALFTGRWTPGATDAKFPRAFKRWDFFNERPSDFWLCDASYLRLKNITLSYTFPSKWVEALKISNIQIYLRGRNVITWDNMFAGYDPERRGWDNSMYSTPGAPPMSRYLAGINIDF